MKTILLTVGSITFFSLLLQRFWKNKNKDLGEYITINGIAVMGNSKKKYKIYKNKWTMYCDGRMYKLDVDNVIINTFGVPHKYNTNNGLQIDDAQVNKDHDSGIDRFNRNRKDKK
jgi:hypothetical protein